MKTQKLESALLRELALGLAGRESSPKKLMKLLKQWRAQEEAIRQGEAIADTYPEVLAEDYGSGGNSE